MKIQFRKETEMLALHDPMQEGKLIDRATEVRYDPLTGETSRIVFDPEAPFVPPDYTEMAGKGWCPFCEKNVLTATPKFPNQVLEEGRIVDGEAVLFPNLFPYGKHNAVIRITKQHYVRLEEFTAEHLRNAFTVAYRYVKKIVSLDPKIEHVSINWNYLPPSGGSILHPHIQVLASEHQTRYQAVNAAAEEQFHNEHGMDYYETLIEEERRLGVRWIGQKGALSWVHAFAPRSHMDFIGVFKEGLSLAELDASSWEALADSLMCFFQYIKAKGLASFNMALFIPVTPSSGKMHIRLVPRFTHGALGTSDMHVLNFLHGESISLKAPEIIAAEAAAYFG